MLLGKNLSVAEEYPPPPAIFLFQVPLCALKALLLSAIIGLVSAAPGSAQKIGGTLTGSITETNSDARVTTLKTINQETVTHTAGDSEDFVPQSNTKGVYGTFTLETFGTRSAVWTYTLQDNWEDTDALNDGDRPTDEFEIALTDGKKATVTITVIGVTDSITNPRTAATDMEVVQLNEEERNRLRISWAGATNAPGGYRLRYREQDATEWSESILVSSTDLSQEVTIDKSNQPYEVEVATRNDKITKPRDSVVANTETTKIFTTRGPIIESIVVEDNNGNRLERVLEGGGDLVDPNIALKITLAEPLLGETDAARRMVMPKLVPASADLEILKSSIELQPSVNSISVRSFARFTDDTELESLESFKVAIGDIESQTVSIVDNEAYAVRFDPASVTLSEGGSQDITLRLNRPYQPTDNSPMRLDLELLFPDGMDFREVPNPDDPGNPNVELPSDDLALAGTGVTFSNDRGRVDIASGSDSVTIRVTAKADGKQETYEQFKVKAQISRFNGVQSGIVADDTPTTLAITINDAAICIKVGTDIPGHDDGCVDGDLDILATEDSPVTHLRGRAVATDPDGPDRSFIPVQTRGTYGKFSLGADGLWVYTLNNADPDTNALGIGQAGRDEFMIETVDGAATRKIRVGVWGANDPATFSGKLSGSVTEDVPFSYEICLRRNDPDSVCLEEGTVNRGVITSGKVTVSDPDSNNASALKKRQGVQRGTYGSLFVNADQGYWRYVLDNDSSHVQGLTAGATVTETFTILAADDTPATVTITITGTRDISTIEGALTGSVTEGGANTRASGTVRVTFNAATNQFRARSNIRGNYGTFNIDARGNWTYDLDGGDLLREGQVVYEPFRVESTLQNRTTAVVVIKVTGSDVVGAITASVGMGAGSRTSGRLTGHRGFEIGAHTRRGDFGCLIIQGNGTWEYLVYDTAPSSDCQASPGTQTATAGDSESFDLLFSRARYGDACSPDDSLDCVSIPESVRFIERTLTININAGIAAVFDDSTLTGAITEDTATTSGTVQVTDADGDDNKFTAAGSSNPISGTYGSLTIDEDGAWTYSLDNSLAAVQALGQGATLNDSLTIQAADGTKGTLVITITGVNDAATIGGTVHGSVTENATNNTVRGNINVTDVDGDNTLQASTGTGTYGDFVVNSNGTWTYTLDNSAGGATDKLNGTEDPKKTDVFTIMAADGTEATVTITITGVNDAATIGGAVTGAITEGTATTTGTVTSTDVDGDNNTFKTEVSPATGTYGSLTITSAGTWTYTLTIVMAGPPICWMEPKTPRRPMPLPSWRRTEPVGQ